MTVPEEKLLLQQFNDTTVEYPANTTLVSLFETAVRQFPQQIALQFGNTSFTYAALHQQSSQLASYLRVPCSSEVGNSWALCSTVLLRMIVAILGVLQAGAAYVPIDPAYPKTRKQYITGDTAIKTLITQTDYIFDLDYFQGTVLAMDVQAAAIQAAVSLPPATVRPAALAYVIYTSGSTGQPKGVMISHGKITNTIFAQWESFGMNEGDRHLQYASLSFDASVSEIFVALASGGTLFVIDEESRKDPALLVKYIRDHQINLATIPPALLKLIDIVELRGLSKLITAGEPAIAAKAIAFSATGQYFNAYGPTESSICATIFHQTGAESFPNEQVPIGKPIANTRIYIIDQYQQLSPIGVEGEICIGGAGLSQGYWNNAALTAEKFIPNPFIEGDTIYRTGDIGRWLADGNIEFIGRKDDQVKIRGNRVELGEIEHALQSHPSITDTAVVTRKIAGGEKEIIAYVVSSEPLQAAALADFLGARLPVYMLPVHYVQLNALPSIPVAR